MRILSERPSRSRVTLRATWLLALAVGLAALLLAACGSSSTTSGNSPYGSSAATSTPTTAATATATTGSTSSSGAVVKTATANVKGASKTILTDSKGMTLYYFTKDKANTSACTGGCASAWPPLLATGSAAPTSATQLSGTLTAFDGANGHQVEYNGHPLYTYGGDSAPGDTNGEGVGGVWFVATADLSASGYGY